ncbi:transketolase family protein [Orenia marismortui]|uniref:Transketolase subunit B n=1 Tax=Orenia marismortui TaxID=46469 RepID=A0A4R8GRN8_9FIRM|nr:transketolase family protein [Orenia marismortui]TDX45181.1 transketolase subunit B [Orenia marismortui]
MFKLAKDNLKEDLEMRQVYSQTLCEMAEKDESIIALEADLMGAIKTNDFQEKFPEQMINCGIMEANMMGVAAGLSMTGKIPFVHTFASFATRRAYDQVFLSGAYSDNNIKIIASDSGITAQHNGGTHMPFEDLGIMRAIPKVKVIEVSDSTMLKSVLKTVKEEKGIHYIRTIRKNANKIYRNNSEFTIGKANVLADAKDATIIASGIMVYEALKAAKALKEEGIEVAVIDMFTIKPIDKELIIEYAQKTGAILTAENHNIINGLGSAVAEVLVENYPVKLKRIGVQDRFGQVGKLDYLQKVYGLSYLDIIKGIKELLAK